MKEIRQLETQLTRVAGLLREDPDPTGLRSERVSDWSVGEQVDHVLKVLESSLARLAAPGKPLDRGINVVGRILLKVGRLPRGVGRSPKSVLPTARSRAELADALDDVRERLRSLAAQADVWRSQRPLVPHPYFGGLTPKQGARMLVVHTDHHLRIVSDIRRAAGR
jgi:hypothetical protein